MDRAKTVETAFAGVFKTHGFRKRGRNWFRTTPTNNYQVINLQKSPWGGDFYINLGWDFADPVGAFRTANQCDLSLRAENADVIPTIDFERGDGLTAHNLPGTILLNSGVSERIPEASYIRQLIEVIATPVAELMDRTPSLVGLVPLLTAKPWFATLALRNQLNALGYELPTEW